MPPKKTSKKKGSAASAGKKKETKKKKVSAKKKAVKRQIEQAVEKIPDLIVEEAIEQTPPPRQRLPQQYHHHHQKKRSIVWIGVSIIGAAICVMWLLNTQATIKTFKNKPQDSLVQTTKTDFETLLSQLSPDETEKDLKKVFEKEYEKDKEEIEQVINGALAAILEEQASTSTEVQPAIPVIQEAGEKKGEDVNTDSEIQE